MTPSNCKSRDGFTVFERFYRYNADGSKDIISQYYLKENDLSPREAVEAMLKGERPVDFENLVDVAR